MVVSNKLKLINVLKLKYNYSYIYYIGHDHAYNYFFIIDFSITFKGTCIDGVNTFSCKCVEGFIGVFCGNNSNDCDKNPCKIGTCKDLVNDYFVSLMSSECVIYIYIY